MAKSEWEKMQIGNQIKKLSTPTYCQLCGKEIIEYGGESDKYVKEIREEAHIDCIRRYTAERQQRYIEQQKKETEL